MIYIYIYTHQCIPIIYIKKNIYEYDFKLCLIYVHNILPPVMKHGQWDHSERKAVPQFPYRRVFSPLVLLGPGNYMVPCFYLSHGFNGFANQQTQVVNITVYGKKHNARLT